MDKTDTDYELKKTPSSNHEDQPEQKSSTVRGLLSEIIKFALLAMIIVVPIRFFVASPFIINGSSMDPTFNTGNYIIVDRISYTFSAPERGDVIVFKYPRDPSKYFIKRIIGLPGETVELHNGAVTIKNSSNPEGFTLAENYVAHPKNDTMTIRLSNQEYFVMGDNRAASSDSRIWGPIKETAIDGRALVRLIPITKIGVFPGHTSYAVEQ